MKQTIILTLVLVVGCGFDSKKPITSAANASPDQATLESALIIGSAESPDPVLTKVMALEKSGVVKDVVVQESFPVQIRLRAPRAVIDELNRIARSGGLR